MRPLLLLLLLLVSHSFQAQETDMIRATCRAYYVEGMENTSRPSNDLDKKQKKKNTAYFTCQTTDQAYEILNEYNNKYNTLKENKAAMDAFRTKNNLAVRKNGIFSVRTQVGMAIVCLHETGKMTVHEIMSGLEDYESIDFVNQISGTTIKGERKPSGMVTPGIDTGDGTETFRPELQLEKALLTNGSRLILQCNAIDCLTEDTVAYCSPLVYEGNEYHILQDRRKDYDFFHKDSLGCVYKCSFDQLQDVDDEYKLINPTYIFVKPDVNRSYRGDWDYVIEDYNRVCKKDTRHGSCLKIRPFKFLDFTAALPEMELTDEFQETAEITTKNVSTIFDLRFVTGQSILQDDSLNEVKRDALIRELQSYGVRLFSPKVIGGASPDGISQEKNIKLARERAQVARNMIEPYLPKRQKLSIDHKVYTWNDVADSLENHGLQAEAQSLRETIEANRTAKEGVLFKAVKDLPFYASDTLQTILSNQRMMQCSYSYVIERVFTADEVVEEYHHNKQDYISGKKHFSSGDFFNLYANLTDSTEQDEITRLAYKELKQNKDWFYDKLTPYTLNRMQRLNQKMGIADTLMLKPFLRLDAKDSIGIDVNKDFDGVLIKLNRRDLLLTQAMSYYQLQKFNMAHAIFNWIRKMGKSVPGMERLEHFMNLKSLYGKDLTEEQKIQLNAAREYVLSLSNENKAIICTEIPEWSTPQQAEDYTDLLDDDNPKKWYLKGIIWARKYFQEHGQPSLTEYDTEDTDSISATPSQGLYEDESEDVPHYLAYFHHCFQLQPAYLNEYYREGHIKDDDRKKQKYLRKDVPEYERIFKLLYRRDTKRRQEIMEQWGLSDTATPEVQAESTPQEQ